MGTATACRRRSPSPATNCPPTTLSRPCAGTGAGTWSRTRSSASDTPTASPTRARSRCSSACRSSRSSSRSSGCRAHCISEKFGQVIIQTLARRAAGQGPAATWWSRPRNAPGPGRDRRPARVVARSARRDHRADHRDGSDRAGRQPHLRHRTRPAGAAEVRSGAADGVDRRPALAARIPRHHRRRRARRITGRGVRLESTRPRRCGRSAVGRSESCWPGRRSP